MRMPAVGVRWHFISGSEEVIDNTHKTGLSTGTIIYHPCLSSVSYLGAKTLFCYIALDEPGKS